MLETLEKEMATHPSTLAWVMPWAEEPGRLPFKEFANFLTRLSDQTTMLEIHISTHMWKEGDNSCV